MRILLVNYEYPPLGGGAGNATMFMSRALARLGHQVIVLTSAFRDRSGSCQEDGVRLHRIRTLRRAEDRSNPLEMLSFMLLSVVPALRLARRHAVDAAIAFFTIPGGPACWALDRFRGVPYAVSLRGGDVPKLVPQLDRMHRLLTPLRRAVLRRARVIVANSPSLGALSEQVDPFPVKVIPNGVDTDYFSPPQARVARDAFRILFVGRFRDQKNLPALLEALAGLTGSDRRPFRLDVVGDGPLREELQALAGRSGIADRVVWHGWLPKEGVLRLYHEAEVFVNPSLYEGMPNTVLEAMACGLPVVASNVGGNDDLVRHGETGFLFALGRVHELAQALLRLRDDPPLRAAMGAAGRALVMREYAWESVAQRYVALLSART